MMIIFLQVVLSFHLISVKNCDAAADPLAAASLVVTSHVTVPYLWYVYHTRLSNDIKRPYQYLVTTYNELVFFSLINDLTHFLDDTHNWFDEEKIKERFPTRNSDINLPYNP